MGLFDNYQLPTTGQFLAPPQQAPAPPPQGFDPRALEAAVAQQRMGQQTQQSQFQQIQVPDVQFSAAMKKQALIQGLGTAGLALLAGMKNTPYPQSPMSNIGQAGLAGMQEYQRTMQNAVQNAQAYQKQAPTDLDKAHADYYRAMANKTTTGDDSKEPGTVVYNNKRYQWNSATKKYDIELGRAKEPGTGLDYFGDKELIKKTLTEIPKLKREAITADNISTQIDRALDLVKTGVTGKGGQVKALLAPYAEILGASPDNMDDSQTFQLLTRAIIGPMRLEIVGPGPVSEWEQKLMQQISGGGGASKQAATELLGHWKKLAESKITNYNDTLEGLSSVYPKVKSVYQPITKAKPQQPTPSGGGEMTATNPTTGQKIKSIDGGKTWQAM